MIDPPGFTLEYASWEVDRPALRAVREVVFVQEQAVPVEEEWDELDARCRHVLARDGDGMPIATARLTPERTIGRMAVLADWRDRGVGRAMLRMLVERARELGWPCVELNAQVDAIGFYARQGFEVCGDEFIEAGIRHRRMRLALSPVEGPPAVRGRPAERPPAQAMDSVDRAGLRHAMSQLMADARHRLDLHTHDLDPGVLDDEAVLAALRRVAATGRGARIRVLLQDPERSLREGHALIPLVQRLTSCIECRVPVEERDIAFPSAFALNDVGGYLFRPLARAAEARGSRCDPREHARLGGYFDEVWERAAPATVLRPLDI